jgi:hypothetical protein
MKGGREARIDETKNYGSHPGSQQSKKVPAIYREGLGLKTKGIEGEEFDNGAVVFLIFRME